MRVNEILTESTIKPSLERLIEKLHDFIQDKKPGLARNAVSAYFFQHYKFLDWDLQKQIMLLLAHETDHAFIQETELVCNAIDNIYKEYGANLFTPYITIVEASCGFYINDSGKLPPSFGTALFGPDVEDMHITTKEQWHQFMDNTDCTNWEEFQQEYKEASNLLDEVLKEHPNAKILGWTYDSDEVYCITVFEGK